MKLFAPGILRNFPKCGEYKNTGLFIQRFPNTELLEICQKWAQKSSKSFSDLLLLCAAAGRRDIQFL